MQYGWSVRGVAGWAAATTASAVIAWAALQPVLDAAVPDRFTPLTGAELRAQPVAAGPAGLEQLGTPPTVSATPNPDDSALDDAATNPPGPDDSEDGGSGGPGSGPGGDPGEGDPSPEPTVLPDDPEVTEDGWTVIESESGTSYLKTFETAGGAATIEVELGQATLLSATATEPYSADVYQEEPERVVVQFYVVDHMYVVEAMWWQGAPYGNITEVP